MIEKLDVGLSAQRIYQDLVSDHGYAGSYYSVRRLIKKLAAVTPIPMRRMLEDCEAGRITTVYVYKWDRFGRSARAHTVLADMEPLPAVDRRRVERSGRKGADLLVTSVRPRQPTHSSTCE